MSIEPQSIVHQVIGIQRKITRTISNGSMKRRRERKAKMERSSSANDGELKPDDSTAMMSQGSSASLYSMNNVDSIEDFQSLCAVSLSGSNHNPSSKRIQPRRRPTNSQNNSWSDDEDHAFQSFRSFTVAVPKHNEYRTINQNEFFIQCMINGNGSQVIHFFKEGDPLSEMVDKNLEDLSDDYLGSEFLRIDGAWTHFVAAKLQITEFPTVVALVNQKPVGRYTPKEGDDAETLDEWLEDVLLPED